MSKKFLPFFICFCTLLLTACSGVATKANAAPRRGAEVSGSQALFPQSEINAFASKLAKQNEGLSYSEITHILSKAETQDKIINLMNKPYEALPWWRYQRLYERPSLIKDGIPFWRANQRNLAYAARHYGVPAQIILAILGVETQYGANQGHYRAIDALYTLSFNYPQRASYFQKELAAYLILTKHAGFDPLSVKSSYAGALGMAQFMPSSYQKYAVSHAKHYPNFFSNKADAIDSAANYLAKAGWIRDAPIAVPARLDKHAKNLSSLQNRNLTLQQFKDHGIHLPYRMSRHLVAQLVILDGKDGPQYYLAFRNFYVIKRYNASNLYTMAVTELSQKLLNAWESSTASHHKAKQSRH